MKAIAQIVDKLEAEIVDRQKLKAQMVGQPYTSILEDEIYRLRSAKYELTGKEKVD